MYTYSTMNVLLTLITSTFVKIHKTFHDQVDTQGTLSFQPPHLVQLDLRSIKLAS